MSWPLDRLPGGLSVGWADDGPIFYIEQRRRLAELEDAATDPFLSLAIRDACVGLRDHLRAWEAWVDARLPIAPRGWYVSLATAVEPRELVASIFLRRHRAACAKEDEVLAAFQNLRRLLVFVMSVVEVEP